ncbi:unnamed protein product [Urochloa humidicola]
MMRREVEAGGQWSEGLTDAGARRGKDGAGRRAARLVVPAADTLREGRRPASLSAPLHPVVLHREISPPPRSSRTDRRRRWPMSGSKQGSSQPRRRRQRRPGGGDAGDEVADLSPAPAPPSLPPRTSTSSAYLPLMLGTTSSGSGTGHGGGRPHIRRRR